MRSLDDWLAYIAGQHWQNIDMGLDRMRTMVGRMDLHRPAPEVITVAGTNGKGSTCIACESLLQLQGLRTGVTLSPHVSHFNERIRIDGQEVDDITICAAFDAVESARCETNAEPLPLTYFEFSALAALWCFQQAAVDVAILEIGLGGRLDAFNVIDADVAVITSIGMDHETYLGNTYDAIGAEKAGILRSGQHVALGVGMPDSVLKRCAELSLQPVVVGQEWGYRDNSTGWSITRHDRVVMEGIPYGACAPHNLLLAYLAVTGITEFNLAALATVAAEIHLPGRMQRSSLDARDYILDVAHNPEGAAFLLAQLKARDIAPQLIVCGMLADKHHAMVAEILSGAFDLPWIFVDTQGERGMQATSLRAATGIEKAVAVSSWQEARGEVISATEPGDVILAFGSFNLIEQFLLEQ